MSGQLVGVPAGLLAGVLAGELASLPSWLDSQLAALRLAAPWLATEAHRAAGWPADRLQLAGQLAGSPTG